MNFIELKKTVEAFADVKESLSELLNSCMENANSYAVGASEWERDIAETYQGKAEIYADLITHLDKLFKAKL